MDIARARYQDAADRDLLFAWQVAAFSRQKTLPNPKALLARRGSRQTVAQQKAALQVMSEQYGIPLRKQGEAPMKPKRGRRRG